MENINNSIPERPVMNNFYRLFCWCSGARLYLLKQCPTEYNKFFGIGIIVFFTGLLAALTGGYAFYTIFRNTFISAVLGLIWGTLIFFLDWYIVSSLRKENRLGKEILSATPRLILSVILAVIISKPLEIRLFQNEIMQEIEVIKRDNEINYQNMVFEEFDEISRLEEENNRLMQILNTKAEQRNKLFGLIVEEAEGRSPTQQIGKGPVYKEKKEEYNKVSAELEALNTSYLQQIDNNKVRIQKLKSLRDVKINNGFEATEKYEGFLARLQALGSLSNKNKFIAVANIFIVLLFMIIESSPVLVKLMSKRGPYDVLFDSEELSKTYDTENELLKLNSVLNDEIENKKQNKKLKNFVRNKSLEDYYQRLTEAAKEINETKIKRWKEKETKKINENFEGEANNISKIISAH